MSVNTCRCKQFNVVDQEEMDSMRNQIQRDPNLKPYEEDLMRSAKAAMNLHLCINCYLGR